jgi:HEAT repeat protein
LWAGVPIGRLFLVTGLQVGLFTTLFYQIAAHLGAEHYSFGGPVQPWEWFVFSFAHALRASDVLDIIEAYGLTIQTFKHNSALTAGIVVAYHLIVDVFVLGVLWAGTDQLWRRVQSDPDLARKVRRGLKVTFVLWLVAWAVSALLVRPWNLIDFPLWAGENVLRVIDFADVMDSCNIHFHQVPQGWWEGTLTFLCRVWVAFAIAAFVRWRSPHAEAQRADSPGRAIGTIDWKGFGIVAVVFALLVGLDQVRKVIAGEPLQVLTKAVNHPDADRSGRALRALRRLGPSAAETIPHLVGAREQIDGERCSAITKTLGYLGGEAIPVLTAVALRDDESEALAAVDALTPIGPNAAPALVQVWKKGSTSAARLAAEAKLLELGTEAVDPLMAATDAANSAEHYKWFVRLDRNWTLRNPTNPTALAVQRFHRKMMDPSDLGDAAAWDTFVEAGSVAIPELVRRLNEGRTKIRQSAVQALVRIGPNSEASVPALIERLRDDDLFVRRAATEALGRIGPKAAPAVPVLVEGLGDKDGFVRRMTIEALGRIGPKASIALPALSRMSERQEKDEAASVEAAIDLIRPPK